MKDVSKDESGRFGKARPSHPGVACASASQCDNYPMERPWVTGEGAGSSETQVEYEEGI